MGDKKMSAYICKNETFKTLYSGIVVYGKLFPTSRKLMELIGFESGIVEKIYEFNVMGVNVRYNEKTATEMSDEMKKEVFSTVDYNLTLIQFMKALDCVHYQMSEGKVMGKLFYKQIEQLINEIARHIVAKTKEYEEAEWG